MSWWVDIQQCPLRLAGQRASIVLILCCTQVVIAAPALDWVGLLVCCNICWFFLDDVTYIGDVEVCVESVVCYIPGCICYGSEDFWLGSLHDDYVGLAGTTPQFDPIAPYWLIIALYTSNLFSMDRWGFPPISQFTSFKSICFLFLVTCSLQFSLQSKHSPKYFAAYFWGMMV